MTYNEIVKQLINMRDYLHDVYECDTEESSHRDCVFACRDVDNQLTKLLFQISSVETDEADVLKSDPELDPVLRLHNSLKSAETEFMSDLEQKDYETALEKAMLVGYMWGRIVDTIKDNFRPFNRLFKELDEKGAPHLKCPSCGFPFDLKELIYDGCASSIFVCPECKKEIELTLGEKR